MSLTQSLPPLIQKNTYIYKNYCITVSDIVTTAIVVEVEIRQVKKKKQNQLNTDTVDSVNNLVLFYKWKC